MELKTKKIGVHLQPQYWLGTSVLIHPRGPQPNSGTVSLVSWMELRHRWGRESCSCRQAREQGVRKSGKAWVSWAPAPLALGSRGNLTSSRSQQRASSKPCSRGEAMGGLPACPHKRYTPSSTLPSRDGPTPAALTTEGGLYDLGTNFSLVLVN